jgi:hypothetical protein
MSAVTGVAELNRLYDNLSKGMANKIARPGLMKAGRIAVKRVKAKIPSRLKDVKKLIKAKSVKTKKNAGVASVKIGAAVGEKKKKKGDRKPRKNRPGVGISSANVHWFFVGTADRVTGFTTRRRRRKTGGSDVVSRRLNGNVVRDTGRMKQQIPGVSEIVTGAKSEMLAVLRASIQQNVEKEAAKKGISAV